MSVVKKHMKCAHPELFRKEALRRQILNILLRQLILYFLKEVKKVAKKGDKYKCEKCGVVLVVDEDCGCSACDVICCGTPMKPVKAAPAKAKPAKAAKK